MFVWKFASQGSQCVCHGQWTMPSISPRTKQSDSEVFNEQHAAISRVYLVQQRSCFSIVRPALCTARESIRFPFSIIYCKSKPCIPVINAKWYSSPYAKAPENAEEACSQMRSVQSLFANVHTAHGSRSLLDIAVDSELSSGNT